MDTSEILQQLQSEDTDLIRQAAFDAGDAGIREAIPLLAEHLKSAHLGVQEAADEALRSIGGPETVQAVIPLLRSDEAPVRNLSMDILREVGRHHIESLLDLLRDEDADVRIFISDILGSSGAPKAVEPLCAALLKDPEVNVRYQAAVSLGALSFPQAAECLNKALDDEEWVQFAVIEALTKVRAESSLEALAKALDSSSDLVASMIVDAMGEMGNIKAVALLLKRLDSAPAALRNKMVRAIVRIMGGKSLTLFTPAERENFNEYLLAASTDEDEEIQDAAVQGLAFIGGERASEAVLKLARPLDPVRDHDRLIHFADSLAAMGLTKALAREIEQGEWKPGMVAIDAVIRMHDPKASALLMEAFWNKDRDMQRALVEALVQVAGEEADAFFMDVLDRHNDGDILKSALTFLGQKSKNAASGDKLFALLEHPYDDVKEAALEACVAIGDEDMLRRFKELFQSPDPMDRFMATYALGRLGTSQSMEEMRLALVDEVPDIRKLALEALGSECTLDEAVSIAVPLLNDENSEVRMAVVQMLGGCPSEDTTGHLLAALDDEDDWVKIRAVEALAERRAAQSVPRLISFLDAPNKLLALKSAEALGEIGGQSAFRALMDLLNKDDPELTARAEDALAKIRESAEA